MESWVTVARAEGIPAGQGRTVRVGELEVAVFNDGGEFFAMDGVCPHQGASLGDGLLHEGRVICPRHHWVFELRTGRCPRDSHEPVPTFPARLRGDAVELCLPEAPRS
jgi:NAD(P)H-dependent nitrite reductase small subunit